MIAGQWTDLAALNAVIKVLPTNLNGIVPFIPFAFYLSPSVFIYLK